MDPVAVVVLGGYSVPWGGDALFEREYHDWMVVSWRARVQQHVSEKIPLMMVVVVAAPLQVTLG